MHRAIHRFIDEQRPADRSPWTIGFDESPLVTLSRVALQHLDPFHSPDAPRNKRSSALGLFVSEQERTEITRTPVKEIVIIRFLRFQDRA
jgi:hypothetical protein